MHTNGHQQVQVLASLVQANGQPPKIVFCTSNGQYVGSISWENTQGAEFLKIMADQFQAYASQQAGGIQIAGASALGGLTKAS